MGMGATGATERVSERGFTTSWTSNESRKEEALTSATTETFNLPKDNLPIELGRDI
jgi:hypothetical protein